MDYSIFSCRKGEQLKKKSPSHVRETLQTLSADSTFVCYYGWGDNLWIANRSGEIFNIHTHTGEITANRTLQGQGEIRNMVTDGLSFLYATVGNKGIYRINLRDNRADLIHPLPVNVLSFLLR